MTVIRPEPDWDLSPPPSIKPRLKDVKNYLVAFQMGVTRVDTFHRLGFLLAQIFDLDVPEDVDELEAFYGDVEEALANLMIEFGYEPPEEGDDD